MYDKDWGCILRSSRQTLRQALTSIDVILQVTFNEGEAKKSSFYALCARSAKAACMSYTVSFNYVLL